MAEPVQAGSPGASAAFVETYRVSVFVDEAHVERCLAAIGSVVSLEYGRYDGVSWCSAPGTERYVPRRGAKPTSGQIDVPAAGASVKLEVSIPRDMITLRRVVEAVYAVHPWEEPVISIIEAIDTRKA